MKSHGFMTALFWMGLSLGVLGSTSCDKTPPVPDAGPAAACSRTCLPSCPGVETCVVPSSLHEYTAFCAAPCTTDVDCSAGMRCAALFNMPAQPPVCVATDVPALCPGISVDPTWHCDFTPPTCKAAQVLMRGFSQPSNRVCGYEYIYCKDGCVGGAAAGDTAHCK